MRTTRILATLLVGSLSACTCGKSTAPDEGAALPVEPAAVPSTSPANASGSVAATSCPTDVFPAKVEVTDLADGVVVTITSIDDGAVRDARARAKHLALADAGDDLAKRCPVAVPGALVSVSDVDGGVTVTLRATPARSAASLQHEVRERQEAGFREPDAGDVH